MLQFSDFRVTSYRYQTDVYKMIEHRKLLDKLISLHNDSVLWNRIWPLDLIQWNRVSIVFYIASTFNQCCGYSICLGFFSFIFCWNVSIRNLLDTNCCLNLHVENWQWNQVFTVLLFKITLLLQKLGMIVIWLNFTKFWRYLKTPKIRPPPIPVIPANWN